MVKVPLRRLAAPGEDLRPHQVRVWGGKRYKVFSAASPGAVPAAAPGLGGCAPPNSLSAGGGAPLTGKGRGGPPTGKGAGGGAPPVGTKVRGDRGKGVGGGAPPRSSRGPGGGKGGTKRESPPSELAATWSELFPHGHYLEAYWPVSKAQYPARELDHSWRTIEDIAESYACVVKLGGRQTQRRKTRASVGRLCVKGVHVEQCFYAIVRESRRAFKGNSAVKFTSATVPLQQPAIS